MVFNKINPDDAEGMAKIMGPGVIDTMLREAMRFCWTMIPADRRTIANLEGEIRRLVERALKDLKEDAEAFGIGDQGRQV